MMRKRPVTATVLAWALATVCATTGWTRLLVAQPTVSNGSPGNGAAVAVAGAGVVRSLSDGLGIALAELHNLRTGQRVRTLDRGQFQLDMRDGDTITVRALGYHLRRVVTTGAVLDVGMTPLPTVLPVFFTTVGQRVIRANESPRSVTVLSDKDVRAAAAISVNQLLRQIPGLQEMPSPPSKTSIAIRGFDDARVLVLVDGEPVAGSLVESRDIGRLSTLATERIEVTKGPSSVEFGSDALGGVINLVQAAPTSRLTVDGQMRVGELGRQEATAGVSQQVGRLGYRLAGGWRQSDRVTGFDAAGSTFNRIYDLRTDVRFALGDRWTVRVDAMASQERQRFPLDATFNGFIDNRGGQGFAELRGTLWGGSVRARAFEQRFGYEYRQSRGLLPIRGSADSVRQEERQSRQLLAYTRTIGAHTLDAGLQLSARALIAPRKVDGDSARDNITEVFLRDHWTRGSVGVTAGARHTASSLWGSSTNPSVGATWQMRPTLVFRTNLARGFRAPGFKEIRYTFFNPAGGYTLVGNPDLQPETSWSRSVGGTFSPDSRVSLDVEWYRNDVDGLIDWQFRGNNAAGFQTYANVNVDRARTQGIETTARFAIGSSTATVGYNHLRARDLGTGLPLSRRASNTARVAIGRDWRADGSGTGAVITDISMRYTGQAPLIGIPSGAPIVGPFSTESGVIGQQGALLSLDAQVRMTVMSASELSIGVTNALGQRPALWTPAFDRQIYAGLRMHWIDRR